MKYKTVEIGGRKRYFGITLKPELLSAVEEKRARKRKTVQESVASPDSARSASDQARAA